MADIIFLGGDIITMDEGHPSAEALAVANSKILSLGSKGECMRLKTDTTQLIDLQGRTLLPGLIESHTHPVFAATQHGWEDISGFTHRSYEEVKATIKDTVSRSTPGKFIKFFGYDPVSVPDLETLSAKILDELAPNNPVFVLNQNMHSGCANTHVLKMAGITKETPEPRGGVIKRDENGHPTGLLVEVGALTLVAGIIPIPDEKELKAEVRQQLHRYASHGFTTIVPMGIIEKTGGSRAREAIQAVAKDQDCPVRIPTFLFDHLMKKPVSDDLTPDLPGSGVFTHIGMKFMIDGSPYSGTMATREPYLATPLTQGGLGFPDPPVLGKLNYPSAEYLYTCMLPYHKKGFQIASHTQGERAIEQTLNAYELLQGTHKRPDPRFRLEHCGLITDDQLIKAKELGATVSFFVDHIYWYGPRLRDDIIGLERSKRFMPVGSAQRTGHIWTIHHDSPCSPPGPFRGMRTAVTRMSRDHKPSSTDPNMVTREDGKGDVIGPEQAVEAKDAVKAFTINAAWQIFHENLIGSLEIDKFADLVILSQNPLTTPGEELDKIEVLATYVGGRCAFSK